MFQGIRVIILACILLTGCSDKPELAPNNVFTIFPNPVIDRVNLIFFKRTDLSYRWEILDRKGEKVLSSDAAGRETSYHIQIGVADFPRGQYRLAVHLENVTMVEKFVK